MLCGLCGNYINPNNAQRVVSPTGKLVLACSDGRMCEQVVIAPVISGPVAVISEKVRVNEMIRKFCRPWK